MSVYYSSNNTSGDLDEEMKTPFVPADVPLYLEKRFSLNAIMIKPTGNSDEIVGYARGVLDIINHLKMLANEIERERGV